MAAADEFNGKGWELVQPFPSSSTGADDFSVFPPSLHEGLTPTLIPTLDCHSSNVFQESINGFDETKAQEGECKEEFPVLGTCRRMQSAKRVMYLGMKIVRSKMLMLREEGRGMFWSFSAIAGLVGILMYLKRRHRKEKELLWFMLLEKDQRIDQLMNQIVKMSEIVASCHKVPAPKIT